MAEIPDNAPAPRLCHIVKWPDFDGYGFNLHADKIRPGQYIGKVDKDSPAEVAGIKEYDRIIEVNAANIFNENHKQVVQRIKSLENETRLLVVDRETDQWYKSHNIVINGSLPNLVTGSSHRTSKESPLATTNGHVTPPHLGDDNGSVKSAESSHESEASSTQPQTLNLTSSDIESSAMLEDGDSSSSASKQSAEEIKVCPEDKGEPSPLEDGYEAEKESVTSVHVSSDVPQEEPLKEDSTSYNSDKEEVKEIVDSALQDSSPPQPNHDSDVEADQATKETPNEIEEPPAEQATEDEVSPVYDNYTFENEIEPKDVPKVKQEEREVDKDEAFLAKDSSKEDSVERKSSRASSSSSSVDGSPAASTSSPVNDVPAGGAGGAAEPDEDLREDESPMSVTPTTTPTPPPIEPTPVPKTPPKASPALQTKLDKSGLNLNMTAAEMRAQLAAKKKFDPRKDNIDLKKKYQIIQNL